jgi:hypothetical protein
MNIGIDVSSSNKNIKCDLLIKCNKICMEIACTMIVLVIISFSNNIDFDKTEIVLMLELITHKSKICLSTSGGQYPFSFFLSYI